MPTYSASSKPVLFPSYSRSHSTGAVASTGTGSQKLPAADVMGGFLGARDEAFLLPTSVPRGSFAGAGFSSLRFVSEENTARRPRARGSGSRRTSSGAVPARSIAAREGVTLRVLSTHGEIGAAQPRHAWAQERGTPPSNGGNSHTSLDRIVGTRLDRAKLQHELQAALHPEVAARAGAGKPGSRQTAKAARVDTCRRSRQDSVSGHHHAAGHDAGRVPASPHQEKGKPSKRVPTAERQAVARWGPTSTAAPCMATVAAAVAPAQTCVGSAGGSSNSHSPYKHRQPSVNSGGAGPAELRHPVRLRRRNGGTRRAHMAACGTGDVGNSAASSRPPQLGPSRPHGTVTCAAHESSVAQMPASGPAVQMALAHRHGPCNGPTRPSCSGATFVMTTIHDRPDDKHSEDGAQLGRQLEAALADLEELRTHTAAGAQTQSESRLHSAGEPTDSTSPALGAKSSNSAEEKGAGAIGAHGSTWHRDGVEVWTAPEAVLSDVPDHCNSPGSASSAVCANAEPAAAETEEELRARLAMAEQVMRKLYRRTAQLEDRLRQEREERVRPPTPAALRDSIGRDSTMTPAAAGARAAMALSASSVARHPRHPRPSTVATPSASEINDDNDVHAHVASGQVFEDTCAALHGQEIRNSDAAQDGASCAPAPTSLDEQALLLLEHHEKKAAAMEGKLSHMARHVQSLEARLLREQSAGEEVGQLRLQIAAAEEERAAYSDKYARIKAEHRALLRSRAASLKGASQAAVAREAAALISELEAHLSRERRENAVHARTLNEQLYLQEQKQCDWHVEKRLLEEQVSALSGQIDTRDRLESTIDAKILSLFGRLQQLEDTNLSLQEQNETLQAFRPRSTPIPCTDESSVTSVGPRPQEAIGNVRACSASGTRGDQV